MKAFKLFLLLAALGLSPARFSSAYQTADAFSSLAGPYLGQKPPGKTPERFADPLFLSRFSFHQSTVVFSPDGREAYWQARIRPSKPGRLGDDGIFVSKLVNGGWTEPQLAPFSKSGMDDDSPFVSPDGTTIYFLSKRPINGPSGGQKVWVTGRTENGWSEPRPLPSSINDLNILGPLSVDRQGHLYFSVWNTVPEYTELSIYRSRYERGKYVTPEKLGPEINRPSPETWTGSPFISPDGSYLIFTIRTFSKTRLYISFQAKNGGWTPAGDLSDIIGNDTDCAHPFVTADGRYLFFQYLMKANEGFPERFGWVQAGFIEEKRAKAKGGEK